MESLNISINKKIAKEKDFQNMVLHMLILRRLMQYDNDISNKYIQCYSLQKEEKDSIEKYTINVEKCLNNHKNLFELTKKRCIETKEGLEKAKDHFRSRNINCFNLVGESELKSCQEVEKRNYLLRLKTIYEQIPEFSSVIKQ